MEKSELTMPNVEVSKKITTESIKNSILSNSKLTDMEKLEKVFALSKDDLKKHDVCLYYAILAVIDKAKKPAPMGDYFNK